MNTIESTQPQAESAVYFDTKSKSLPDTHGSLKFLETSASTQSVVGAALNLTLESAARLNLP